MQILNLNAKLNIETLKAEIRTLANIEGGGGSLNYNDLYNKPSINSIILQGNINSANLNIKTSDLINNSGFITSANIPTKTSQLVNDSGFIDSIQLQASIPTDISAFNNDVGYITAAQVGTIPTKTSQLVNDSGFITAANTPVQSVNELTGNVNLNASNIPYDGISIEDKIIEVENNIPKNTSDLINNSGFITAAGVPTKTSELVNDSGYITDGFIKTNVAEDPVVELHNIKIGSIVYSIPAGGGSGGGGLYNNQILLNTVKFSEVNLDG